MPVVEIARTVLSNQGLTDAWAQLHAHVAAMGPWDLVTASLCKFSGAVDPGKTFADLLEVQVADWAEYLAIASTGWGAAERELDGRLQAVLLPLLQWTGPAAGGGPTVYGIALKSVLAGTHYLSYHAFPAGVPMTDASQVLTVPLAMVLGPGPFLGS